MFRSLLRRLFKLLLWLVALSALLVLLLRWVAPPFTALMIERKVQSWSSGESIDLQRSWRPWSELPDDLKMAVIAAEDQKFAEHWGFDVAAIRAALAHNEQGGSLRGASTLSQQVAKNLFLWQGRSWVRKGLEAWYTVLVEALWPKRRILEVYVNTAEFGDGIYGAQAAARSYWRIDAARLSDAQSARLAAVLPSPRRYSAVRPGPYVQRRAAWIQRQVRQLGGRAYLDQLE